VDEEASRVGQQARNYFLTENFEGTIAVAHLRSQQHPHEEVIAPGEESPLPRILPIDPVTDGQRSFCAKGKQRSKIREMKLAIGVRKSNPVAARGLQS